MSNELKTSIVVSVSGNLEAQAQRYGRSMERFGGIARRSFEVAGRGLDALGNRYTALLTGVAGVGTAKMVMDLETRFVRLGINAGQSAEQVKTLKDEIFKAASASDVRVDPGKLTTAVETLLEKTNDIEFVRDNIRNIALAIQATGDNGEAVGEIMGDLWKAGIKGSKEMLASIDTLNMQGKEGGFGLAAVARISPRIVSSYTAMGRSGAGAMKELGAAMQVLRMGTGDPRKAAVAFESIMQTFQDTEKVKDLRKLAGIEVFDPERLKKGERVLRPINELLTEIVQKSGGDLTKIGQVFDGAGTKGLQGLAEEFKRTGKLDSLNKFMTMQGDGKSTMADSARAAQTASAALTNLYAAWQRFADSELAKPLQSLADALNGLDEKKMNAIMQTLKWGGIALGGAIVARKAYTGGKALVDMYQYIVNGKGKGEGGAAGNAMGLPVPLPVYIVDGAGAGGGGTKGLGSLADTAGKLKGGTGLMARAGQLAILKETFDAAYAAGSVGKDWIDKGLSAAGGRDMSLGTAIFDLVEYLKAPKAATVKVEVEGKDGARARVKEAIGKDVDVETESGLRVSAGGGA